MKKSRVLGSVVALTATAFLSSAAYTAHLNAQNRRHIPTMRRTRSSRCTATAWACA